MAFSHSLLFFIVNAINLDCFRCTWGEWAIAMHGRYESPILFISFAYIYSCIFQQFTLLCTDITLALNPPHSLNNYTDFLLCILIGLSMCLDPWVFHTFIFIFIA